MLRHTHGYSSDKRKIGVVRGTIDRVHERRSFLSSGGILSVALNTIPFKISHSRFCFRKKVRDYNNNFLLLLLDHVNASYEDSDCCNGNSNNKRDAFRF